MRRIAVTGHRGLSAETARRVDALIRAALAEEPGSVTGITCLADGADQIFARAVLDGGGQIEAVVPAANYPTVMTDAGRAEYDRLLSRAACIRQVPFSESSSRAHQTANEVMLAGADELWAVWDGEPVRGNGGTADAVASARERGIAVRVIWPDNGRRVPVPGGEGGCGQELEDPQR